MKTSCLGLLTVLIIGAASVSAQQSAFYYETLKAAIATGDPEQISDAATPLAQASATVYNNDGASNAEPSAPTIRYRLDGDVFRRVITQFDWAEVPHLRQDIPQVGFDARVYVADHETVVVAYGGTSDGWDKVNDVMLALDIFPPQFILADQLVSEVTAAYPNHRVILTGHSLGGALAIYAGQKHRLDFVTFNGANLNNRLWEQIPYEHRASFIDRIQLNLRTSLEWQEQLRLLSQGRFALLRKDIVSRLNQVQFPLSAFDDAIVEVVEIPVHSALYSKVDLILHDLELFWARTLEEQAAAQKLADLLGDEIPVDVISLPPSKIYQGTVAPDYVPVIELETPTGVALDALARVLVIDKSGSMKDDRRLERAKQAARALIRNHTEDGMNALVAFESSARVLSPFGAEPGAFERALSGIQANGGTDIVAGLQAALDLLQRISATNRQIILLSDGEDNGNYTRMIERLKAAGIEVHTIGMGIAAGDSILETIATGTYGSFQTADNLNVIQSMFAAAHQVHQTLLEHNGLIRQGERQLIRFALAAGMPPDSVILGQNTWPGSRLSLRLLDARGQEVPGLTITDTQPDFESFTLSGLPAGNYAMEVLGAEVSNPAEPYNLSLFGNARGAVQPPSLPSETPPGQTLSLPLWAENPVPDNAVLEIRQPGGQTTQVSLSRDQYDPSAKCYPVQFANTAEIGFYDARVVVDGVTRNRFQFRVGGVEEVLARNPAATSWLRQAALSARQQYERTRASAAFNEYAVTGALALMDQAINGLPQLVEILERHSGNRPEVLRETAALAARLTRRLPVAIVGLVEADKMHYVRGVSPPRSVDLSLALRGGLLSPGEFFEQQVLIPLSSSLSLLLEVEDEQAYESALLRLDAVAEPPYDWDTVDRALAYQLARNLVTFYAELEMLRHRDQLPKAEIHAWLQQSIPQAFAFMALELRNAEGLAYLQDRHTLLEPDRMRGVSVDAVEAEILDPAGNPSGTVHVRLAITPQP